MPQSYDEFLNYVKELIRALGEPGLQAVLDGYVMPILLAKDIDVVVGSGLDVGRQVVAGFYEPYTNILAVSKDPDMEPLSKFKTVVHEVTHALNFQQLRRSNQDTKILRLLFKADQHAATMSKTPWAIKGSLPEFAKAFTKLVQDYNITLTKEHEEFAKDARYVAKGDKTLAFERLKTDFHERWKKIQDGVLHHVSHAVIERSASLPLDDVVVELKASIAKLGLSSKEAIVELLVGMRTDTYKVTGSYELCMEIGPRMQEAILVGGLEACKATMIGKFRDIIAQAADNPLGATKDFKELTDAVLIIKSVFQKQQEIIRGDNSINDEIKRLCEEGYKELGLFLDKELQNTVERIIAHEKRMIEQERRRMVSQGKNIELKGERGEKMEGQAMEPALSEMGPAEKELMIQRYNMAMVPSREVLEKTTAKAAAEIKDSVESPPPQTRPGGAQGVWSTKRDDGGGPADLMLSQTKSLPQGSPRRLEESPALEGVGKMGAQPDDEQKAGSGESPSFPPKPRLVSPPSTPRSPLSPAPAPKGVPVDRRELVEKNSSGGSDRPIRLQESPEPERKQEEAQTVGLIRQDDVEWPADTMMAPAIKTVVKGVALEKPPKQHKVRGIRGVDKHLARMKKANQQRQAGVSGKGH